VSGTQRSKRYRGHQTKRHRKPPRWRFRIIDPVAGRFGDRWTQVAAFDELVLYAKTEWAEVQRRCGNDVNGFSYAPYAIITPTGQVHRSTEPVTIDGLVARLSRLSPPPP
jgi:hypothetical protein